jgi:hypothetical protein
MAKVSLYHDMRAVKDGFFVCSFPTFVPHLVIFDAVSSANILQNIGDRAAQIRI